MPVRESQHGMEASGWDGSQEFLQDVLSSFTSSCSTLHSLTSQTHPTQYRSQQHAEVSSSHQNMHQAPIRPIPIRSKPSIVQNQDVYWHRNQHVGEPVKGKQLVNNVNKRLAHQKKQGLSSGKIKQVTDSGLQKWQMAHSHSKTKHNTINRDKSRESGNTVESHNISSADSYRKCCVSEFQNCKDHKYQRYPSGCKSHDEELHFKQNNKSANHFRSPSSSPKDSIRVSKQTMNSNREQYTGEKPRRQVLMDEHKLSPKDWKQSNKTGTSKLSDAAAQLVAMYDTPSRLSKLHAIDEKYTVEWKDFMNVSQNCTVETLSNSSFASFTTCVNESIDTSGNNNNNGAIFTSSDSGSSSVSYKAFRQRKKRYISDAPSVSKSRSDSSHVFSLVSDGEQSFNSRMLSDGGQSFRSQILSDGEQSLQSDSEHVFLILSDGGQSFRSHLSDGEPSVKSDGEHVFSILSDGEQSFRSQMLSDGEQSLKSDGEHVFSVLSDGEQSFKSHDSWHRSSPFSSVSMTSSIRTSSSHSGSSTVDTWESSGRSYRSYGGSLRGSSSPYSAFNDPPPYFAFSDTPSIGGSSVISQLFSNGSSAISAFFSGKDSYASFASMGPRSPLQSPLPFPLGSFRSNSPGSSSFLSATEVSGSGMSGSIRSGASRSIRSGMSGSVRSGTSRSIRSGMSGSIRSGASGSVRSGMSGSGISDSIRSGISGRSMKSSVSRRSRSSSGRSNMSRSVRSSGGRSNLSQSVRSRSASSRYSATSGVDAGADTGSGDSSYKYSGSENDKVPPFWELSFRSASPYDSMDKQSGATSVSSYGKRVTIHHAFVESDDSYISCEDILKEEETLYSRSESSPESEEKVEAAPKTSEPFKVEEEVSDVPEDVKSSGSGGFEEQNETENLKTAQSSTFGPDPSSVIIRDREYDLDAVSVISASTQCQLDGKKKSEPMGVQCQLMRKMKSEPAGVQVKMDPKKGTQPMAAQCEIMQKFQSAPAGVQVKINPKKGNMAAQCEIMQKFQSAPAGVQVIMDPKKDSKPSSAQCEILQKFESAPAGVQVRMDPKKESKPMAAQCEIMQKFDSKAGVVQCEMDPKKESGPIGIQCRMESDVEHARTQCQLRNDEAEMGSQANMDPCTCKEILSREYSPKSAQCLIEVDSEQRAVQCQLRPDRKFVKSQTDRKDESTSATQCRIDVPKGDSLSQTDPIKEASYAELQCQTDPEKKVSLPSVTSQTDPKDEGRIGVQTDSKEEDHMSSQTDAKLESRIGIQTDPKQESQVKCQTSILEVPNQEVPKHVEDAQASSQTDPKDEEPKGIQCQIPPDAHSSVQCLIPAADSSRSVQCLVPKDDTPVASQTDQKQEDLKRTQTDPKDEDQVGVQCQMEETKSSADIYSQTALMQVPTSEPVEVKQPEPEPEPEPELEPVDIKQPEPPPTAKKSTSSTVKNTNPQTGKRVNFHANIKDVVHQPIVSPVQQTEEIVITAHDSLGPTHEDLVITYSANDEPVRPKPTRILQQEDIHISYSTDAKQQQQPVMHHQQSQPAFYRSSFIATGETHTSQRPSPVCSPKNFQQISPSVYQSYTSNSQRVDLSQSHGSAPMPNVHHRVSSSYGTAPHPSTYQRVSPNNTTISPQSNYHSHITSNQQGSPNQRPMPPASIYSRGPPVDQNQGALPPQSNYRSHRSISAESYQRVLPHYGPIPSSNNYPRASSSYETLSSAHNYHSCKTMYSNNYQHGIPALGNTPLSNNYKAPHEAVPRPTYYSRHDVQYSVASSDAGESFSTQTHVDSNLHYSPHQPFSVPHPQPFPEEERFKRLQLSQEPGAPSYHVTFNTHTHQRHVLEHPFGIDKTLTDTPFSLEDFSHSVQPSLIQQIMGFLGNRNSESLNQNEIVDFHVTFNTNNHRRYVTSPSSLRNASAAFQSFDDTNVEINHSINSRPSRELSSKQARFIFGQGRRSPAQDDPATYHVTFDTCTHQRLVTKAVDSTPITPGTTGRVLPLKQDELDIDLKMASGFRVTFNTQTHQRNVSAQNVSPQSHSIFSSRTSEAPQVSHRTNTVLEISYSTDDKHTKYRPVAETWKTYESEEKLDQEQEPVDSPTKPAESEDYDLLRTNNKSHGVNRKSSPQQESFPVGKKHSPSSSKRHKKQNSKVSFGEKVPSDDQDTKDTTDKKDSKVPQDLEESVEKQRSRNNSSERDSDTSSQNKSLELSEWFVPMRSHRDCVNCSLCAARRRREAKWKKSRTRSPPSNESESVPGQSIESVDFNWNANLGDPKKLTKLHSSDLQSLPEGASLGDNAVRDSVDSIQSAPARMEKPRYQDLLEQYFKDQNDKDLEVSDSDCRNLNPKSTVKEMVKLFDSSSCKHQGSTNSSSSIQSRLRQGLPSLSPAVSLQEFLSKATSPVQDLLASYMAQLGDLHDKLAECGPEDFIKKFESRSTSPFPFDEQDKSCLICTGSKESGSHTKREPTKLIETLLKLCESRATSPFPQEELRKSCSVCNRNKLEERNSKAKAEPTKLTLKERLSKPFEFRATSPFPFEELQKSCSFCARNKESKGNAKSESSKFPLREHVVKPYESRATSPFQMEDLQKLCPICTGNQESESNAKVESAKFTSSEHFPPKSETRATSLFPLEEQQQSCPICTQHQKSESNKRNESTKLPMSNLKSSSMSENRKPLLNIQITPDIFRVAQTPTADVTFPASPRFDSRVSSPADNTREAKHESEYVSRAMSPQSNEYKAEMYQRPPLSTSSCKYTSRTASPFQEKDFPRATMSYSRNAQCDRSFRGASPIQGKNLPNNLHVSYYTNKYVSRGVSPFEDKDFANDSQSVPRSVSYYTDKASSPFEEKDFPEASMLNLQDSRECVSEATSPFQDKDLPQTLVSKPRSDEVVSKATSPFQDKDFEQNASYAVSRALSPFQDKDFQNAGGSGESLQHSSSSYHGKFTSRAASPFKDEDFPKSLLLMETEDNVALSEETLRPFSKSWTEINKSSHLNLGSVPKLPSIDETGTSDEEEEEMSELHEATDKQTTIDNSSANKNVRRKSSNNRYPKYNSSEQLCTFSPIKEEPMHDLKDRDRTHHSEATGAAKYSTYNEAYPKHFYMQEIKQQGQEHTSNYKKKTEPTESKDAAKYPAHNDEYPKQFLQQQAEQQLGTKAQLQHAETKKFTKNSHYNEEFPKTFLKQEREQLDKLSSDENAATEERLKALTISRHTIAGDSTESDAYGYTKLTLPIDISHSDVYSDQVLIDFQVSQQPCAGIRSGSSKISFAVNTVDTDALHSLSVKHAPQSGAVSQVPSRTWNEERSFQPFNEGHVLTRHNELQSDKGSQHYRSHNDGSKNDFRQQHPSNSITLHQNESLDSGPFNQMAKEIAKQKTAHSQPAKNLGSQKVDRMASPTQSNAIPDTSVHTTRQSIQHHPTKRKAQDRKQRRDSHKKYARQSHRSFDNGQHERTSPVAQPTDKRIQPRGAAPSPISDIFYQYGEAALGRLPTPTYPVAESIDQQKDQQHLAKHRKSSKKNWVEPSADGHFQYKERLQPDVYQEGPEHYSHTEIPQHHAYDKGPKHGIQDGKLKQCVYDEHQRHEKSHSYTKKHSYHHYVSKSRPRQQQPFPSQRYANQHNPAYQQHTTSVQPYRNRPVPPRSGRQQQQNKQNHQTDPQYHHNISFNQTTQFANNQAYPNLGPGHGMPKQNIDFSVHQVHHDHLNQPLNEFRGNNNRRTSHPAPTYEQLKSGMSYIAENIYQTTTGARSMGQNYTESSFMSQNSYPGAQLPRDGRTDVEHAVYSAFQPFTPTSELLMDCPLSRTSSTTTHTILCQQSSSLTIDIAIPPPVLNPHRKAEKCFSKWLFRQDTLVQLVPPQNMINADPLTKRETFVEGKTYCDPNLNDINLVKCQSAWAVNNLDAMKEYLSTLGLSDFNQEIDASQSIKSYGFKGPDDLNSGGELIPFQTNIEKRSVNSTQYSHCTSPDTQEKKQETEQAGWCKAWVEACKSQELENGGLKPEESTSRGSSISVSLSKNGTNVQVEDKKNHHRHKNQLTLIPDIPAKKKSSAHLSSSIGSTSSIPGLKTPGEYAVWPSYTPLQDEDQSSKAVKKDNAKAQSLMPDESLNRNSSIRLSTSNGSLSEPEELNKSEEYSPSSSHSNLQDHADRNHRLEVHGSHSGLFVPSSEELGFSSGGSLQQESGICSCCGSKRSKSPKHKRKKTDPDIHSANSTLKPDKPLRRGSSFLLAPGENGPTDSNELKEPGEYATWSSETSTKNPDSDIQTNTSHSEKSDKSVKRGSSVLLAPGEDGLIGSSDLKEPGHYATWSSHTKVKTQDSFLAAKSDKSLKRGSSFLLAPGEDGIVDAPELKDPGQYSTWPSNPKIQKPKQQNEELEVPRADSGLFTPSSDGIETNSRTQLQRKSSRNVNVGKKKQNAEKKDEKDTSFAYARPPSRQHDESAASIVLKNSLSSLNSETVRDSQPPVGRIYTFSNDVLEASEFKVKESSKPKPNKPLIKVENSSYTAINAPPVVKVKNPSNTDLDTSITTTAKKSHDTTIKTPLFSARNPKNTVLDAPLIKVQGPSKISCDIPSISIEKPKDASLDLPFINVQEPSNIALDSDDSQNEDLELKKSGSGLFTPSLNEINFSSTSVAKNKSASRSSLQQNASSGSASQKDLGSKSLLQNKSAFQSSFSSRPELHPHLPSRGALDQTSSNWSVPQDDSALKSSFARFSSKPELPQSFTGKDQALEPESTSLKPKPLDALSNANSQDSLTVKKTGQYATWPSSNTSIQNTSYDQHYDFYTSIKKDTSQNSSPDTLDQSEEVTRESPEDTVPPRTDMPQWVKQNSNNNHMTVADRMDLLLSGLRQERRQDNVIKSLAKKDDVTKLTSSDSVPSAEIVTCSSSITSTTDLDKKDATLLGSMCNNKVAVKSANSEVATSIVSNKRTKQNESKGPFIKQSSPRRQKESTDGSSEELNFVQNAAKLMMEVLSSKVTGASAKIPSSETENGQNESHHGSQYETNDFPKASCSDAEYVPNIMQHASNYDLECNPKRLRRISSPQSEHVLKKQSGSFFSEPENNLRKPGTGHPAKLPRSESEDNVKKLHCCSKYSPSRLLQSHSSEHKSESEDRLKIPPHLSSLDIEDNLGNSQHNSRPESMSNLSRSQCSSPSITVNSSTEPNFEAHNIYKKPEARSNSDTEYNPKPPPQCDLRKPQCSVPSITSYPNQRKPNQRPSSDTEHNSRRLGQSSSVTQVFTKFRQRRWREASATGDYHTMVFLARSVRWKQIWVRDGNKY